MLQTCHISLCSTLNTQVHVCTLLSATVKISKLQIIEKWRFH